jgi:hypothetical protein
MLNANAAEWRPRGVTATVLSCGPPAAASATKASPAGDSTASSGSAASSMLAAGAAAPCLAGLTSPTAVGCLSKAASADLNFEELLFDHGSRRASVRCARRLWRASVAVDGVVPSPAVAGDDSSSSSSSSSSTNRAGWRDTAEEEAVHAARVWAVRATCTRRACHIARALCISVPLP